MATPTVTTHAKVSRFPRRCGPIPGARLVDAQLLAIVGFTDHLLERFAKRTGLSQRGRDALEPIVCDLLRQEGLRVPCPPPWARVRPAPFYMQVGEYLLLPGRPDRRGGVRCHTITTVVAREDWTWREALEHDAIATPLPWTAAPPEPEQLAPRWATRWRGRAARMPAQTAQVAEAAAFERVRSEHQAAREAAHLAHLERHGFVAQRRGRSGRASGAPTGAPLLRA